MRSTDSQNSSRNYFRAQDRVFTQNGQWFFTAREGEIGPFNSRDNATREAARFVQERRDLARFQQAREKQTNQGQNVFSLSILPKSDESDLTLDELMLENQS